MPPGKRESSARMDRERLPFAGTFRAAATFAVVCYHSWLTDVNVKHAAGPQFLDILGAFGVACFFALSGFLLARPYITALLQGRPLPPWFGFARDRFLRIYPLYAFVTIAIALLNLPNPGVGRANAGDIALHLSFLFVLRPDTALRIDPPMWTMATDVQFYVALPLIFAALAALCSSARVRPWLAVSCGVAVLIAASIGWRFAHAAQANAALNDFGLKVVLFEQLPAMFTAFGGGILGALAWCLTPLARRKVLGAAALVLSLPFLYYGLNNLPPGIVPYIVLNDVFCGAGAALLLVAGCALLPNRLFESTPVMWAERLSYGVYLIHFFVIQYVTVHTIGLTMWKYFFATALASYAVSSAIALPLYLFVERPFLRLKSTINKRLEHYLEPAA